MQSIAIVLFDQAEVLDFAGPFEVFSVTGRRKVGEPFHVFTVAERDTVSARNNFIVKPTYTFANCPRADMILVPGGGGYDAEGKPFGTRHEMENPVMLAWIKGQATSSIMLSVCTGSLILGRAGLLDGLEVTTHHLAVDLQKKIAPTSRVSPEKRFVDNGRVVLSAGVSAGIDMAFHIVSRLQGPEVAKEAARYMEYELDLSHVQ